MLFLYLFVYESLIKYGLFPIDGLETGICLLSLGLPERRESLFALALLHGFEKTFCVGSVIFCLCLAV